MSKKKKKKNKQKVVYYDDNSTIADMSNIPQRRKRTDAPPSTFKDKAKTYFSAVRMMLIPLCIGIIVLCVLFFIMYKLGGG